MSDPQEKERLVDELLIIDFLEKLRQEKCPLSVSIAATENVYTSMIVAIDEPHKKLYLDELSPISGHRLLLTKKNFSVTTHLQGVPAQFHAILDKPVKRNGYTAYQTPLPNQIEYQQKRKEHRVPVGIGLRMQLYLQISDTWEVLGRIIDISSGGIALILEQHEYDKVAEIPAPIPCRLIFREETVFNSTITLCHQQQEPHGGKIILGTCFIEQSAAGIDQLNKIIREIERENIRKKL